MAKTISQITILIAVLVAALAIPSSALATNSHQDHQGACARATTSIKKGVSDLRYNGVATKFAQKVGIIPADGSITAQLNQALVIGKVAKATKTKNHRCDGHGGYTSRGLGPKYLPVGMPVALVPPPSLSKDVCSHPSSKCKSIIVTVKVVFPWSCWNLNIGTIKVRIWIKKDKVPPVKPKPPTVIPPPSGGGCSINIGGDNNGVVGCNVTVYCSIVGKQITDSTVCSNYENCVAHQGYTWDSTQNVCVSSPPPPPTCEQSGTCSVIHITSWTDLNDIPYNRDSGPFYVTVNASASGGSLTIDPGIGGISDCASSTPIPTGYTASLSQGNTTVCVKLYAPKDVNATTMKVTAIANLGSASDSRTQDVAISHPVVHPL